MNAELNRRLNGFEKLSKTTLCILQPLLAFWSILLFVWTICRLGIVILQLYWYS